MRYSKAYRLTVFILLFTVVMFASASLAAAHEEGMGWLIVPYSTAPLQLETNHFAAQWSSGREIHVSSPGGSDISLVALNDGTRIFFHIRWPDATHASTEDDGIVIFYEGAGFNDTDDVWLWSTNQSIPFGAGVQTAANWEDGYWNVALERTLAAPEAGTVNLNVGESKEGFVKVAAWDGAEGQSLNQIDPESLTHLNLYILPSIDYYPKDSFVWLSILGVGLVVFTYKELRLGSRKETE